MIFVSSSCFKKKKINELLSYCKKNKIKNLEFSGGSEYQKDILKILTKYSKNFNYSIHNYFPPPKENFIINLGSINNEIRLKSIIFCKKSIDLCKKLKIKFYSIHAPFLIDFETNEAGKKIAKRKLYSYDQVLTNLKKSWKILTDYAGKDVNLYLENNVINKKNFLNYNKKNPFLLTDYDSYKRLRKVVKFKVLLDIAHLKVSSQTLKNNFFEEALKFSKKTNYFHISDNNGLKDQNNGLRKNGEIFKFLKNYKFKKKAIFTLEIYKDLSIIKKNIKILKEIL